MSYSNREYPSFNDDSFQDLESSSFEKENFSIDLTGISSKKLSEIWNETLKSDMHGICFSLYKDGQKPGDIIPLEQVNNRIEILKPFVKWIRSFSCTDGNEHIPVIAKNNGIKTLVGAWLGNDLELNEKEIEGLISLAKQGYVDIAAVGNEVMYRGDLTETQLLNYLKRVKTELPNIPVGYVDAYYEFSHRPNITEACDVILTNCYPYWEGCPIEHSLNHFKNMYFSAQQAGNGKRVIITETGWPSQGGSLKGAIASNENAMEYFIKTLAWCKQNNIENFYFSSFDESWKVGPEGEVGAYWGLWDKNEILKF